MKLLLHSLEVVTANVTASGLAELISTLRHGTSRELRVALPPGTHIATVEQQRFWFVLSLSILLVGLTVILLFFTRDQGEQISEGARVDGEDEETPAARPAAGPVEAEPELSRLAEVVQQVHRSVTRHVVAEKGLSTCELNSEELIKECGISGLCVVDPNATCGVTGVPVWTVVVTSAVQCWTLQFFVLYWLFIQLKPRYLIDGAQEELPWSIVFVATYTHFVSCVADFPLDFYLLFWIRQRKEPFRWIFVTVFLMDAFLIPTLTLVIGSLYLSNSRDVHETILNCCAVAFISHIDDWILAVSGKMEMIVQRTDYHKQVKVKINRKVIQRVNWWVSLIPVVPTAFTVAMMWMAHRARL